MDKTNLNKDAVTQRILETTQETERLKQELQSLIAAGISGSKTYIPISRTNLPLESTNKVQIVRSFDPQHSQHIKKPLESSSKPNDPSKSTNEAQALSPKKPKTYDVHQAREYIKRQRDKRKEECKSKKTETKITAEMRKEKLQELQQKASELVKKNVEAKRHKSKSRERVGAIPANESVIVGFNCAEKTKKHLEEPNISHVRNLRSLKDPNLLYPPEVGPSERKSSEVAKSTNSLRDLNLRPLKDPNLLYPPELGPSGRKSSEVAKSTNPPRDLNIESIAQNKHFKSLQNLPHPPEPHYEPQKEPSQLKSNKSSENLSKSKIPKDQLSIIQSNITLRDTQRASASADFQRESKYVDSKSASHRTTDNYLPKQSSIIENEDKLNPPPVTLKSSSETQSPNAHSKPASLKSFNIRDKKIKVLSDVVVKHADNVSCKAEDHKEKTVTPEWLKDTVGQGDPYNFINTVKRQLRYVANEKKPQFVDVGVQGNLDNMSESNKADSGNKSDLKSFISHRCLNLDPHTIQHVELDGKKSHLSLKDGPTITNDYICSDYDSDTSKNIPSLSSESGTSLRRNAGFVKQNAVLDLRGLINAPPNLDTKTVDNIKLKKTSKVRDSEINTQEISNVTSSLKVPLQEDVERIKKKLFDDSDSYSSDFIKTDLSRSRDSLISFNCAKVSPNRVPDHYQRRSENENPSPLKSNSNVSFETGAIPKTQSQTSEKRLQESDRKSRSLNSLSEDGSQKRNSRSAQFYSLYSDLNPSTIDPELKAVDHNVAQLQISKVSDSEVATDTSEKNDWKSDGFTEVLKPKDLVTDSDHSLNENIKTISSLKESEKSESELKEKSKSEQIVSNKRNTAVFSKSESNIYENKENLKGLPLKEPKLSLNIRNKNRRGTDESGKHALMKNISIRSGERTSGDVNNTNEIHLKFEAEIHLLNDFNQSLRHFSEIEKAFESLRSRNDSEVMTKKVLQNRDTQTSIITKTSTKTVSKQSDRSSSQISTINYSRGSGIESEIHSGVSDNGELSKTSVDQNNLEISKQSEILLELTQGSELNNVLNSVNLEDTDLVNVSERTSSVLHISELDDVAVQSRNVTDENLVIRNFAGMSLRMFDQLIKDEDARIENWKKIVKIREQALLDRTRGELVYLEMQKKQLIETGKLPEASLIKKKQRGILLKHQQEKHEMQRLKQMQKEASAKRKTLLKKEKNLIKNQLLSDNMLSKLKSSSHRERNERRLSGPLKVIQATSSVHSETSLSKGVGGTDQEIKNITSRTCSVVLSTASDNLLSDIEPLELTLARSRNMSAGAISSMKKRLLMREQALAKRRKTVEELLQWHKKLLEEEKAIEDLESKVEKIISKIPSESNEEPSKQPLDLSKSISDRTSSELNIPSMSQAVLDRLLLSKENVSVKSKSVSSDVSQNIPQEENISEDSNRVVSSANYSTDFDVESVPEVLPQNSDDSSNVSSISQLIKNFSKIEDNILNLSLVQKRQSLESEGEEIVSANSARTDSTAAEEVVQEVERSEASSQSNQITSEVEVKVREESPSEIIQREKQKEPVEDSERSVVIVEEPSEPFTAAEEDNLVNLIKIEEIKESPKKESESLQTDQSKTESASESSLAIEELVNESSEVVSLSEKLKDTIVPDDSNKNSLEQDAVSKFTEEPSAFIVSNVSEEKYNDKREVSEEIADETNKVEERIVTESTGEQTREYEEKQQDLQNISTDNEQANVSLESQDEISVQTLKDIEEASQDIVAKDGSENTLICEESKPSTSHQETDERSHIPNTKEANVPSISNQSFDHETPKISALILSEEPVLSVCEGNGSTSQRYEEIEDLAASSTDIPSNSRQTEEQATSSQILSLTKDDVSNRIEEQEQHSHSHITTPSILENRIQSSSMDEEEERQSFENKTDEEKVASLSIRASGNQSASVSEDKNKSSVSITRPSSLAVQEPSVSGGNSVTISKGMSERTEGSVVSEKSLSEEASAVPSDERLSRASVKDLSSISVSSKKGSVEKKPSDQGRALLTEEESKVSSVKDSDNSTTLKVVSGQSLVQESGPLEEQSKMPSSKKDEVSEIKEKQSEASLIGDITVSAASSSSIDERSDISATKSIISSPKSISLEEPTRSSASKEKSEVSSQKLSTTAPEKSPRPSLDVKKRVQEILNEASPVSRGDKSPRMQDLCVMTYDLISPTQSPESGSPLEEKTKSSSLGSEAEELLRKQLEIEQEIKLLTEQQQKEQAPQFYIREIPNKPPPPYTPPSKAKAPKTPSIIPSSKEEIEQITEYSAKIIHKAYLSNNLDNISISDNTLNLIAKNIDKGCYKYVFDLCKEVAIDHYSQFIKEEGPSWLQLEKKIVLAPSKPLDVKGLKKLMNKKLLELFLFEKQEGKKENAIMKWSRKKRDHVDEVLVQEMQAQESSWTSFDRDELIVKDRITNEIMEMLLKETAQVLKKTVQKKSASQ